VAGSITAGARWALLSGLVARLGGPAFLVVLARILAPEDFGLMAVAMVVVAFAGLFQDLGLKAALVQRKEAPEALRLAVFWGSAAIGAAWFAGLWLVAPWAAEAFRNPAVTEILRALCVTFLLTPLGTVPEALLLRELAFRPLFAVELVPSLVPGAVAVALGLAGLGVWALVWGTVTAAALRTLVLWRMVPWRPRGWPPRGAWHGLWRFGGWLSLEALLGWSITYVDQAFAGRFLGTAALGYYRMGHALALLPAAGVSQVLARVLLPAYSRHQDDRALLREAFERCVHMVAVVTVPVGAAAMAFADPLVPLVLGARWAPAVPVVQLLAAQGVLAALVNVAPPLYKAIGRVDVMPKFFLVRAAVSVPAYWYGAQQGLVALVMVKLLLTCGFAPVNFFIGVRVFGASLRRVLVPIGIATAAAAVAAVLGRGVGSLGQMPPILATATALAVFSVAYLALVAAVSEGNRRELRWLVRSLTGLR
jgi:O-antigen/teichoic acid export membrane protein